SAVSIPGTPAPRLRYALALALARPLVVARFGRANFRLELLPAPTAARIVKTLRRQLPVVSLHDAAVRIAMGRVEWTFLENVDRPPFAVLLRLDAECNAPIVEPLWHVETALTLPIAVPVWGAHRLPRGRSTARSFVR